MQESLGRRLRLMRAERGLSLREAARRAGVVKETISEIERGKTHPYDVTLAKLAKAYDVPLEELLEEETVPLDKAPEAGAADDRKGPDPEGGGADEDRPKPPMPESAGKHIHVQIEGGQVTITETAFLDLIRAARAGRLTDEDARQRLLDESA